MTAKPIKIQIRTACIEGELGRAAELIADAFVEAKGSQVEAAKIIDVSGRQLRRWMTWLLERGRDVRAMTEKRGVPMNGLGGAGGERAPRPRAKPAKRKRAA